MNGFGRYLRCCGRKRRFRTEIEAENHGQRWGQRAYECPCCGGWHLTSKEKRKGDEHA